MQPKIVKIKALNEYYTPEHCFIAENYTAEDVSVARATVKAGVSTHTHRLTGVKEIYIITAGSGKVTIGNLEPTQVEKGDVVIIPAGISQKITNIGKKDLVFYCICTPRFTADCYSDEEKECWSVFLWIYVGCGNSILYVELTTIVWGGKGEAPQTFLLLTCF